MSVSLVRPTLEHKEEALAFKKEFFDYGEKEINGSEMLDHLNSYDSDFYFPAVCHSVRIYGSFFSCKRQGCRVKNYKRTEISFE